MPESLRKPGKFSMAKKRLDVYVTEAFSLDSRQQAQNYIIQGYVRVCGREERKPGYYLKENDEVELSAPKKQYVSRGGYKLAQALDCFGIDPSGMVCIDAGASTGGFTDCLLQRGALKVYAVDVGRGQIDESLRRDGRVVVMEDVNVRYLDSSVIPEKASIVTADLSFISLDKVLAVLSGLLDDDGIIVALVKPQFEAGRGKTDRGVVKDVKIHISVLENAVRYGFDAGLYPVKCVWSPIKGPSGNIEFLMMYSKKETECLINAEETAKEAWRSLGGKK